MSDNTTKQMIELKSDCANIVIDGHLVRITNKLDVEALYQMFRVESNIDKYTSVTEDATVVIVQIMKQYYAIAIMYNAHEIYTGIYIVA